MTLPVKRKFDLHLELTLALKDVGLQTQYAVAKGEFYYRPPANGYTNHLCEAARYTKEEALKHLRGSPELRMEEILPDYTGSLDVWPRVEEWFNRKEIDLYNKYRELLGNLVMHYWILGEHWSQYPESATARHRFEAACAALDLSIDLP